MVFAYNHLYKKILKKLNFIKIIIKLISDEIDNLAYMFSGCTSLKSIVGLKYLDTKNIKSFSFMFYGCSSLSDIKGLKNWNTSNCQDFSAMFYGCSSLSDIKGLQS